MRPDGLGTDSYDPQASRQRRNKSTNSIERDVIRVAIGFVVVAIIICCTLWLTKRAYLTPEEGNTDPTLQQPA